MRTAPYCGALAGGEIPCAHACRAIIGGCPAPAFSTGIASASAAVEASAPARPRAPTPPLTSTRCRRTPLSVRPARSCTAVVPPVHTGSPTCLPPARGASGPCPWSPAETHSLQLPSAFRKRSSTPATAGVCHSTPRRSATRSSLTVVPAGPSLPSQRSPSTGRGGPASATRTPPGAPCRRRPRRRPRLRCSQAGSYASAGARSSPSMTPRPRGGLRSNS